MDGIPIKLLLPFILSAIQLLLKNSINKRVESLDWVKLILEIPVSLLFVSLSLLASAIVTESCDAKDVILQLFIILLLVVITINIWKKSILLMEDEKYWHTFGLSVLNLIFSIPTTFYVIFLLTSLIKVK